MPRTIEGVAPDPSLLGPRRAPLFDLTITVVTPLFGGSASPRETDEEHPVRAASVRGHLRFWWRACKGAHYAMADELFQAEEQIWGSTTNPGCLTVHVQTLDAGHEISPRSHDYPGYALFPFQENRQKNLRLAHGREGVQFRLRIGSAEGMNEATGKELQAAAEAAVWAWLSFGGIGARTRRGCGSLYCSDSRFRPTAGTEHSTWLSQVTARHIASSERQLCLSVLTGARIIMGIKREDPIRSWQRAVELMQGFRQAPVGRPDTKVPGRSRWPEAESIRAIARSQRIPDDAYFPRADLGLPIITHFKPGKDTVEPSDSTLQARGSDATRMASPIILKPLALSEKEAIPLVLCLNAPHVWDDDAPGVSLSFKGGPPRVLSERHLRDDARRNGVEPLAEYGATAREAFLSYAKEQLRGAMVTLP